MQMRAQRRNEWKAEGEENALENRRGLIAGLIHGLSGICSMLTATMAARDGWRGCGDRLVGSVQPKRAALLRVKRGSELAAPDTKFFGELDVARRR